MTTDLESAIARGLADFLPAQRWFGGKGRSITDCDVRDLLALDPSASDHVLAIAGVSYSDGGRETYGLLVACRSDPGGLPVLARTAGPEGDWVVDASTDPFAVSLFLRGFGGVSATPSQHGGRLEYGDIGANARHAASSDTISIVPVGAEQSNTSLRVGGTCVLKLVRRLEEGENPELEVSRFLNLRTGFRAMPPLEGSITYRSPRGESYTLGVLHGWIESDGDGWSCALRGLERDPAGLAHDVATLGRITAEFHFALEADQVLPAFSPEAVTLIDTDSWVGSLRAQSQRSMALLQAHLPSWEGDVHRLGETVLSQLHLDSGPVPARNAPSEFCKIRIHGDYHLGQTLKTPDGFAIIDFEGEPAKSLRLRRAKACALKDVAGMLRSFEYAIETVAAGNEVEAARLRGSAGLRGAFLQTYLETSRALGSCSIPRDSQQLAHWLQVFELEKALYELEYEINHRPGWVAIPLRGIAAAIHVDQ